MELSFALGRLSLEHVAQGGTLAEEVISSVRTVQAFGTQRTLSALFDSHIARSRRANFKLSVVQGCSMGFFYFCFLASYGLGESGTFQSGRA
jgi:ATP-binding cassette subfamily B (MDR/TAP) protein 1